MTGLYEGDQRQAVSRDSLERVFLACVLNAVAREEVETEQDRWRFSHEISAPSAFTVVVDTTLAKSPAETPLDRRSGQAVSRRAMSNLDRIVRELVIANRILANQDVVDAYGHVSTPQEAVEPGAKGSRSTGTLVELKAGRPLSRQSVTGSALSPRSVDDSRHSSASVASCRCGARRTSVPIGGCASRRARGAPRQK